MHDNFVSKGGLDENLCLVLGWVILGCSQPTKQSHD